MEHYFIRLGSCVLILSILISIPHLVDSQTFCEAGNFTEGESANISCFFPTNINATGRNFNVVLHSLNSPRDSGNGIYVKLCNWALGKSLECTGRSEYALHSTQVTNNVTLTISRVNKAMEGSYFCQEVPGNGQPTQPCSLLVSALRSSLATTTLATKSEDIFGTTAATGIPQGQSSQSNEVLIAFLVIFILISLLVSAALVCIRFCFRLQPKRVHGTRETRVLFAVCCIRQDCKTDMSEAAQAGVSSNHSAPSLQSKVNDENIQSDVRSDASGGRGDNSGQTNDEKRRSCLIDKMVVSDENVPFTFSNRPQEQAEEKTCLETAHLIVEDSHKDCDMSDKDQEEPYVKLKQCLIDDDGTSDSNEDNEDNRSENDPFTFLSRS